MTPRSRAFACLTAPLVIGLGLALMAAPMAQAATTKEKAASESGKESSGKKTTAAKTTAKEKTTAKGKEASESPSKGKKTASKNDDDAPAAKSKTATDKKTKDAPASSKRKSDRASEYDDKTPVAKAKSKTASEKSSDSKTASKKKAAAEETVDTPKKASIKGKTAKTRDDEDVKAPAKSASKADKSKAVAEAPSKRKGDDAPPKSSETKTTADAKKTSSKTDDAPTRAAKSDKLAPEKAPPVKAAPVVAVAPPAPAAPQPVLNAAPVAYKLVAGQGAPLTAAPVSTTLSASDVDLYKQAFTLIGQGEYDDAEAQLAQVSDKSLVGYAEFQKLFSGGYDASYDELIGWLNAYGDHPMAMRVWNLAKRKKPDGAADPAFPLLNAPALPGGAAVRLNASTTLSASTLSDSSVATAPSLDPTDSDLTPKSARSAYNNGQMDQAVQLGRKIGDHWVAGLALWRQHKYEDAQAEFKFVSTDPSRNAWSQASGAYWAGRCAMKMNRGDDAQIWFKIAASFPFTFYGLLAEARLGVTPAVQLAQKGLPPTFSHDQASALAASLGSDFAWAQNDTRARRMNALVQIGRTSDAKGELQTAIQTATNGDQRDQWLALAARTRIPVTQLSARDRLFDSTLYPLPDLKPRGGYTVDKALIFAFARKESKFNAKAYSYSGAYGLLQLMPGTAALVENDSSFAAKPKQLLNPATNLRVGQHYIQRLQGSTIVGGDLLRTIAAYNAGPRPVKDAMDSLGSEQDSLLVMESIPVAQTRQYVEEVAANYWIYRQIMGKSSNTLALAASDARVINLDADAPPPPSDDDQDDGDDAADTVAMATR